MDRLVPLLYFVRVHLSLYFMPKEKKKPECILYLSCGLTVEVEHSAEQVAAIRQKTNADLPASFVTKYGVFEVPPKYIIGVEEMAID